MDEGEEGMTRKPKAPKMPAISEAEWQRRVILMAQTHGWLVAHFRPGMSSKGRWMTAVAGDGKGFPDLVLCHQRTGRVLFVELKRDDGKTTPEQDKWLRALCGEVWRPRDFDAVRERLSKGLETP